jgi:hypothetical protein
MEQMACAGKRGRRGRQGEEDEKNTTTNQTSALDGRAAVVGGMVVVAASIGAVLAVVWEEIFGRKSELAMVTVREGDGARPKKKL